VTAGVTIPRDEPDEPVDYTRQEPRDPRDRPASAPLIPNERYETGALLGRGGMGEVFAAQDLQIGRDVAIKRLRSDKPSDAALARFLREARIQGRLEHPAIPPVYELAHDHDGHPYFAMRKIEGVTLAQTLRDPKSRFTQQRLLRAFVDVCHAIALAHSKRVVHRDLKPANILLGAHGEVYVLDWGIARELDAPDAFNGVALGTPGYMAPEQIRAEPDLDERVDIYALGCILFEIAARRPLFPHGEAAIEPALRGEFPYDVDLPLELATACRRATHVQRTLRFASVQDLIDVVQRFLDGDRDLEQRRGLARHHLTAARDAFLSTHNDGDRRTIVMREAGKALALDPTLDGPAELISRIMLEPPKERPPGVERDLAELHLRGSRLMARVQAFQSLLYLVMLPVTIWLGVRDVPYMIAYGAIASAMLGTALLGMRFPSRAVVIAHRIAVLSMFALLARMWSPVLVAPGLAAVTLVATAFHPFFRGRAMITTTLGVLAACLGVWAAEALHWLPPTLIRRGGDLVFLSPLKGHENLPAFAVLAIIYSMMILMAAATGFYAMREIRVSREKLVVQAWHLRQLVGD